MKIRDMDLSEIFPDAGDLDQDAILRIYLAILSGYLQDQEALDPTSPDFAEKFNDIQSGIAELRRDNWDELKDIFSDLLEGMADDDSLAPGLRELQEEHQHAPMPPQFITTAKRATDIEYPLDKVNSQIWRLLEEDTSGQLAFKAEKSGSGKPINIYYAIDFDSLEDNITISRRLTAFDKRAYIAISALYNAGGSVMTMTQIYYAMGYTGKPGRSDLERINTAVTKMTGARIYVNNEQEAGSYKYAKFIYDGSLLPAERGTAMVNGKFSDAAIHLFREPPVISFAKQRSQITTIDVKLLQSPMNKTDQNLLLDDYLIERIARARKRSKSHKILYRTLYERVGANTAKQRGRIPDKVAKYLDHYRQCGMITGYEMGSDGVTVRFS